MRIHLASVFAGLVLTFAYAAEFPEEACAYWSSKSPEQWSAALEHGWAKWTAIKITPEDIQAWRAQRAKTEPYYARTVSSAYIRNHLKALRYLELHGPVTDQEVYQHMLLIRPEYAVGLAFDGQGRAIDPDSRLRAQLDRGLELRPRYEILRDGLDRAYCFCTADPGAKEVCAKAARMTDADIKN